MPRARGARAERQELSDNIVGVTANVVDLNTKVYQHKAVLDDSIDELRTNMGARETHLHAEQEELFWGIQRQMDQARERYDRILWVVFLAILWLMLGWGWFGLRGSHGCTSARGCGDSTGRTFQNKRLGKRMVSA